MLSLSYHIFLIDFDCERLPTNFSFRIAQTDLTLLDLAQLEDISSSQESKNNRKVEDMIHVLILILVVLQPLQFRSVMQVSSYFRKTQIWNFNCKR